MAEYELVYEIKNLCRTEKGAGGSVTIHAVVDGLIQKYVFTPV